MQQDLESKKIAESDLKGIEPPKHQASTIAQLYSQLQATLDNDKFQRNDESHVSPVKAVTTEEIGVACKRVSATPSSSRLSSESDMSTGNSSAGANSPVTPRQNTAELLTSSTCICQHWLVSIDSEHCGVCDELMPFLKAWQEERSFKSQTIQRSKSQLYRLLEKQKEQDDQIQELQELQKEKQATIERRVDDMTSMRQDLQILGAKYKDETSQIEEIQRSKESVKRELEELSQRLFEQVNEMVNIEKQEKQQIQTANDALKEQLAESQEAMDAIGLELQVLRTNMSLLDQGRPGSPVVGSGALGDLHEPLSPQPETASTALLQTNPDAYMLRANIDLMAMHRPLDIQIEASENDHALTDFRQFMDTAGTAPIRKLHSLPFLAHCLNEDIRPTLRFGPNPRIASRKIIDAMLVKTCIVEECPPGFAKKMLADAQAAPSNGKTSLWDRFTIPAVFHGCQACGRQVNPEDVDRVLTHRFRTSYFDEWMCIDRYCRDRLESVIQFYAFLRQLRIGTYHHRSLTDLYQECSRLRLQMLLCRMGMLPSALHALSLDTDVIGKATPGPIQDDSSGRGSIGNLSNSTDEHTSKRLSSSTEPNATA